MLVFRVKAAFALDPSLAVSVIVREATTPAAKIGEPFIFKGNPMNLAIFQGYKSNSA